jgi:hypothetical protein
VRRLIVPVVLVAALAVPASAWAIRAYTGPLVSVILKTHKDVVKGASVADGVPLKCDEGSTKTEITFGFDRHPRLKHRKFSLKTSATLVFQTIDADGAVVSTDKAEFDVAVRGRFRRSFKRVSGTLTMNGSYFGPQQGPNGSDVQYHHCSGTVDWSAHKGF